MRATIILTALTLSLGCGKKDPVQGAASNTEATKPEPTKAKVSTGVKLWEFETKSAVFSSPGIGPDGTLYVGSRDNNLYAIDCKSGAKLWEFEMGDMVWSSPAVGPDGTIYVGSYDKKIYAIKTDSIGLAKTPWPMRGQNPQHTGRALAK